MTTEQDGKVCGAQLCKISKAGAASVRMVLAKVGQPPARLVNVNHLGTVGDEVRAFQFAIGTWVAAQSGSLTGSRSLAFLQPPILEKQRVLMLSRWLRSAGRASAETWTLSLTTARSEP